MLAPLISALENQTLHPDRFEVVIVDDGSTDGTDTELRAIGAHTNLSLLALRSEPNRGRSHGRNLAWRSGSAPVVAFTDDDCLPEPQWLERGLAAVGREKAILVGRTVPAVPFAESGPFSRTMNVDGVEHLATCNIFYSRDDLEAADGFDESFQIIAEDTDLAWRIRDITGRRFAYEPAAIVRHAVRPSRFLDALRESTRGYGIPLFVSRHPSARRTVLHRRYFWLPSHSKALLALAGTALLVFGIGVARPLIAVGGSALWLPWLRHRLRAAPLPTRSMRRRPLYLPGAFVIDLAEVLATLRGSLRYRTLVL